MAAVRKVLLVDDSMMARAILRHAVEEVLPDAAVVEAVDGTKGFEVWQSEKPDLAIIDYNMPGENGLELAQQIRAQAEDVRLILCTANIQHNVQQEADALGMSYINKPVNSHKLASILGVQ